MRNRLAIAGTAAAIAAAVSLVGGVLRDSSGSARTVPVQRAPAADRLEGGFAAGDTAGLVRRLAADLRARPSDAHAYMLLGLAYQQRARETGNPVYYTKSAGVLRRAAALDPNDAATTSALGSLALARHRFGEALVLGRRVVRQAPYTSRNYGVLGDALVELGRYREAFRAFDRMGSLRPDLAAYARISYARELLGRPQAAARAMELALDAAGGRPEPTAWAHTQLGKLAWSLGRVDEAEQHYRAALAFFPGYVYALEPLALVEEATGQRTRAIALARRAAETLPLPQAVATLGDLYARAGRRRAAAQQYALVGVIERVLVANGVRTALETALFDVDHRVRLRSALALAQRAHRARPSIDADDVLAWALARNGRCSEALPYSRRALRLGTLDALKTFHRGMIERCLGHEAAARAAALLAVGSRSRSRPGAGGLRTLRFEAIFAAGRSGSSIGFRDTNFAGRIGWREVVVRAERGARILSASVPADSASDALRAYPRDLLSEPLQVSSATAEARPGSATGVPPRLGGDPGQGRHGGGFEALIARDDLGPGAILLGLVIAAFWGAAHALTPGHGKAIVAGYLVGSQGRPRHAVLLGLIVTATHTAGVFALGLVTLLLSHFVVPERLYPWLTLASGLLVVGVGTTVLRSRLRHSRSDAHHHHHHGHEGYGRGGLLGVGVAAGLLPCPSALVVLLSAIALHRIGLGLALIVAFSAGLAATITAIGLVAVFAQKAFGRLRLDGRLVHALPAVSALVILVVGIGITVKALPGVL